MAVGAKYSSQIFLPSNRISQCELKREGNRAQEDTCDRIYIVFVTDWWMNDISVVMMWKSTWLDLYTVTPSPLSKVRTDFGRSKRLHSAWRMIERHTELMFLHLSNNANWIESIIFLIAFVWRREPIWTYFCFFGKCEVSRPWSHWLPFQTGCEKKTIFLQGKSINLGIWRHGDRIWWKWLTFVTSIAWINARIHRWSKSVC